MTAAQRSTELSGTGSVDDPLRRGLDGCVVRGCSGGASTFRVTGAGFALWYCYKHAREAARYFDLEPNEEPAP